MRIKFLLASLIASANGITLAFSRYSSFDLGYAILTMAGVFSLHASIDLLNDYWDYKRGIDKIAKRTKFSGGTGVLPENVYFPRRVYTRSDPFFGDRCPHRSLFCGGSGT